MTDCFALWGPAPCFARAHACLQLCGQTTLPFTPHIPLITIPKYPSYTLHRRPNFYPSQLISKFGGYVCVIIFIELYKPLFIYLLIILPILHRHLIMIYKFQDFASRFGICIKMMEVLICTFWIAFTISSGKGIIKTSVGLRRRKKNI